MNKRKADDVVDAITGSEQRKNIVLLASCEMSDAAGTTTAMTSMQAKLNERATNNRGPRKKYCYEIDCERVSDSINVTELVSFTI